MEEKDIKNAGQGIQEEALEALKGFIKINTVLDEKTASKDSPFGKGVRKGLDYVADLGRKLGFNVDFCDHYATELSYGEGPFLDIYAHADVVPVSPHWETDPFYPTIKNGVMYARGCSDDKGPGIAALYGAKIALDQKWIQGYKLRIIFGGNEETGSKCLEHYFHAMKKGYPAYGFSPDADYPLIYAEKGIFTYKAEYEIGEKRIPDFSFGNATNIVLDEAVVKTDDALVSPVSLQAYLGEHKEVKGQLENGKLSFKGLGVHGSVPWMGVNAGLHLLNYFGDIYSLPALKKIYQDYAVGDGKAFKGNFTSAYFDSSSYCIGVMSYKEGKLTLLVNMRLPENKTAEDALKTVEKETKPDKLELLGGSPCLIMDPKSEFIQTLLKIYQEETGDYKSQPEAIGGGTYARDSKNSVAFGMQFPGMDVKMHQDGEFMRIEDFNQSIVIYARAIKELGELIVKEHKKA